MLTLTDVRQTYGKLLATVRRVSYGGVAGNGCLRTTYSYPAELGQGSGAYLLYFYPRYLKMEPDAFFYCTIRVGGADEQDLGGWGVNQSSLFVSVFRCCVCAVSVSCLLIIFFNRFNHYVS